MQETPEVTAFRDVPKTGVIFVMTEAEKHGYDPEDPEWVNLGQGQPEIGELPEAGERIRNIEIREEDHEYAPIAGIWELREAVADHYNRMYRRGMPTKYSAENVCISGGGRLGLTRVAASMGTMNLGHFLPDYTTYEELLGLFRLFSSIPILLDPERNYQFPVAELREEILGRGLSALLMSNPCNPTGKLVGGDELAKWVETSRDLDCSLILDEFYSHYIWNGDATEATAARYVEDVDEDPVVIVHGLTKSWRYPGWRVSWTLAPQPVVDRLSSAGSFLDGGASRPLQRAAVPLLEEEHSHSEVEAIKSTFGAKRDMMLERLDDMGISVDCPPDGTFYLWGDVSQLPAGLDNGMDFLEACLDEKLICVPGEFFDVNPGQRRAERPSRFRNHVRFSFGPPREGLERGLDRMAPSGRLWGPDAVAQAPNTTRNTHARPNPPKMRVEPEVSEEIHMQTPRSLPMQCRLVELQSGPADLNAHDLLAPLNTLRILLARHRRRLATPGLAHHDPRFAVAALQLALLRLKRRPFHAPLRPVVCLIGRPLSQPLAELTGLGQRLQRLLRRPLPLQRLLQNLPGTSLGPRQRPPRLPGQLDHRLRPQLPGLQTPPHLLHQRPTLLGRALDAPHQHADDP